MRNAFLVLCRTLPALLSLVLVNVTEAQWTPLPGPRGVRINVLYEVGSVLFAGTETRGVYRSTDNGVSWSAANAGIENARVSDLIVSHGYLLAGVANTCGIVGAYRSTDGGDHWQPTAGLAHIVNSFGIKNGVIYATAFDLTSSIYRSSDDGASWQQVPSPIQSGEEVFVSGNAILVSEFNFIWRSINDGASWAVVEQFAFSGVKSFAQSGSRILGAGVTGLYSSINNGISWQYSPFDGGALSLASSGSTVFLGGGNRISKSTDAGVTWNDASSGLGRGDIRALLLVGSRVFAGTPADISGIYASSNGGASWFPSSAGLPVAPTIRALISMGNDLFVGTEADGIYRSRDEGDTWAKVGVNNPELVHQLVVSFCENGAALFAGTADGIFRSTDQGETFERIVEGLPKGGRIFIPSLTVSGDHVVAAASIGFATSSIDAIFYSSDDGESWHESNFPVSSNFISAVASDGSDRVYAGSYGDTFSETGLYGSTDQGVTWFSMTSSLMVDIERLAVVGTNVLAGTLFSAFYSIDGGESFAPSSPDGGGIFAYALIEDLIFAGNQLGLNYSTTRGAGWIVANQGFACPSPSVESLCTNPTYVFAGTDDNGLWRRPLSDFGVTGIGEMAGAGSGGYWLSQNFPNPAISITTIEFAVPRSGNVVLEVFDALGRQRGTIAKGEMAPGTYRFEWNADGLASGVYYYRLEAGDFSTTRKLTVLKRR